MNSSIKNESSFTIIRLSELLAVESGGNIFNSIVSGFSSKNSDVELFLKEKAVISAKLNTSSTYLVAKNIYSMDKILGYFTLAIKMLTVKNSVLSNSSRKIIQRFGYYDKDSESFKLPAILIAQFSKNFSIPDNILDGKSLMNETLKAVKNILNAASGKITFLECEDNSKIIAFYESVGFEYLDSRLIENSNKKLIQMYKII